uniref:YebC/PmpR family DNA-binding transcriptional regulator n=1 Tax=Candidatus Magnetaquicoccus inordinatus TaxID=2496818 RepID=UPI00102C775F
KGAQDAKRGKIFTKLIREITTAARMGGSDISANARLRGAVLAARTQNMPKDTIDRAIKRGAGGLDGANYEEARYEGYGPGGVAVIVETLTDNFNRTVADVRHAFTKYGGNMGTSGCVAYLFDNKGELNYENCNEDALMEAALEAGAEDVVVDGQNFEVITAPDRFQSVQEALAQAGFNPIRAELTMRPQNSITLDEKQAISMLKLVDMLEDNDDVQKVYANFDIPDEIMERLE